MPRLILMRHAKSDWRHSDLSDHDRPLNKRGKASARALGDWMRQTGYLPDEVLCSSAERTGQTLLGLDLPQDIETTFTRSLYHAGATVMMSVLATAHGKTVLMVGHNPGICTFAHRILQSRPDHSRFADYPTGATLVCDLPEKPWNEIGWHQGQPIAFVIPRELV